MKKFSIIQRNKDKGSKIWYLRIFDPETHRIKYKSLNTTVKYKAEQLLEKEKQKIYLNPDQEKAENLPPLKNLFNSWINFVESSCTADTARIYKSKFKAFFDFCHEHDILKFTSFTAIHANDVLNAKQIKPSTKRNTKAVYLSFFNWILSTYDIDGKNAFEKVKTPKAKKPIRGFWTPEQIDAILNNCTNKEIKLCFAFMAFCGLRISETLNLKWENLTDTTIEIINGKGGKNAVLPLSNKIKEQIRLYKESTKATFKDSDKIIKIPLSTINDELKRTCKKAGIDGHNHLHKFRHSFASNLLRNGGNIIAVSKLMRHSSPSMTLDIYSHILPNDLDQTLNLLDGKTTKEGER